MSEEVWQLMIEARDNEIAALQAERDALRGQVVMLEMHLENHDRLRAALESDNSEIVSMDAGEYIRKLMDDVAALRAERDQLRAALETITKLDEKTYKDCYGVCYAAPTIARRALEGK